MSTSCISQSWLRTSCLLVLSNFSMAFCNKKDETITNRQDKTEIWQEIFSHWGVNSPDGTTVLIDAGTALRGVGSPARSAKGWGSFAPFRFQMRGLKTTVARKILAIPSLSHCSRLQKIHGDIFVRTYITRQMLLRTHCVFNLLVDFVFWLFQSSCQMFCAKSKEKRYQC